MDVLPPPPPSSVDEPIPESTPDDVAAMFDLSKKKKKKKKAPVDAVKADDATASQQIEAPVMHTYEQVPRWLLFSCRKIF